MKQADQIVQATAESAAALAEPAFASAVKQEHISKWTKYVCMCSLWQISEWKSSLISRIELKHHSQQSM